MDRRIKSIVIIGGGTAGWMAATYLAESLDRTVSITVIEAPTIPRIGVGEATVPNLQRVFFDHLRIPEEKWMVECNASYKMAVKFINWCTPGPGVPDPRSLPSGASDHFYHPFGILDEYDGVPLSHYWYERRYHERTSEAFDYACFREPPLMDHKRGPRLRGQSVTRYAWHFDARLVADFLKRHAIDNQGAEHVADQVVHVVRDARGHVAGVRTAGGRTVNGDLFVDCSGFRGLLINQTLNEPFLDMSDQLLNDSAVASAIVSDDAAQGIEPYTSAIAMPAGWTWKIPLLGRFGSGYVFSSKFTDRDEATRDFCRLWGLDPDKAELNQVSFRVGRNRRAWVDNVVAIGLSSCFLEPLESSGIYFIYGALHQLAKHFPDQRFDPALREGFNRAIEAMYDETRDFIQAHFYLSPRVDTPFWAANKELRLADQFTEKLAAYKAGLAVNQPATTEDTYYNDFDTEFRNFWTNGSYYSIFAGLGCLPDVPLPALMHRPRSVRAAARGFDDIKRQQRHLQQSLPSHYESLLQLHRP